MTQQEPGALVQTSNLQSLLKKYFQCAKELNGPYILSLLSLILSVLFVSKVFDYFVLNFLYFINIGFFALVARDSWKVRKDNYVPLVVSVASIALTSILLIDILKGVDILNTLKSL